MSGFGTISRACAVWLLLLGGGSALVGQEPCSGGGEGELLCWFDLGFIQQAQADATAEPQQRSVLLAQAASYYERALAIESNRGAVLNNLAQVYADLGRDVEAGRLFERAVVLNVPLRPFFLRNYADFLNRRGDWMRAAEHYRKALEEEPEDYPSHVGLVAILSLHRPEALAEYLWSLVNRRQAIWVEEVVLEKWEKREVPRNQEEEYLTLLVASEAEQSYLPEEFPSRRAAAVVLSLSRQAELSGQPEIGDGAREVLRAHEGNNFDPASYSWWAQRGRTAESSTYALSPRQVFRHLLRSLGDALHRSERYEDAREYFRLAILLTQDEPDLLAFRKLVNLPSSEEDVAAVNRLAETNERSIRQSDPKRDDLYLYRHDLGLFYGFLEHWGEVESPASGIYQLSHAIEIGKVGPPDGPPDTATFDARVYSRLAAGYTETGRPEQARQTLYALVEAYRSHDMDAEAAVLLAMLNSGQGGRRAPDRRQENQEIFDDPPIPLRDFTTEPPEPPQ